MGLENWPGDGMEISKDNSLKINKMKKYTVKEFLKAAEIGEVSMIDAKHIVSLLDEARNILSKFDCQKCSHSMSDGNGGVYCFLKDVHGKNYHPNEDEDCGGAFYRHGFNI